MFGVSVAMICQGVQAKGEDVTNSKFMRPGVANDFTDVSVVNRLWNNLVGRNTCPLTTLLIFCSVLFSHSILSILWYFSLTPYSCETS